MKRRRFTVIVVVLCGLLVGACGGGGDSGDYSPVVAAEFVISCSVGEGATADTVKICECSFAGIVQTGIPYDRFVEVDDAGLADPDYQLPLDLRVPLNDCLADPDAYDPNETVYPADE